MFCVVCCVFCIVAQINKSYLTADTTVMMSSVEWSLCIQYTQDTTSLQLDMR